MKENKTRRRIISFILLLITLLTNILPIFQYTVLADSATITYGGPISYAGSTVGKFWINGNIAFCVDHKKTTPAGGTYVESEIYENDDILKCLYYGWGGKEQYSFASEAQGIVFTTLALDHFKNGNANRTAQPFIDYVNSKPVPQVVLNFSNNTLNAYMENGIQKTNNVNVTGSSEYSLTIHLQDGVTLVNETKNTRQTGWVNVNGGDWFHLEAPLTINGSWQSDNIDNHKYKFQPILYRTQSESLQDIASGYKVVNDPSSTINLNVNWLSTGSLAIHKTDAETGKAIANTTFELRNSNDSVVTTVTTDSSGFAKVDNITVGTYKLVEKKSNDNYVLKNEPITVEIATGQTKTVDITNDHKTGKLKIVKVDSRDNKTPIEGVTFEIWNTELNKKIATKTTNKNGEIFLDNIRTGQYLLKETSTNKLYQLDTSTNNVVVQWNQTATATISNDIKTGFIEIIKQDGYTNKKLEKVTFEIRNSKNVLVDTLVTDKNGHAKSKALPLDEKYIIKETKTDENYILLKSTLNVSFDSTQQDETKTLTINNDRKTGHLKVYKVDKDNNKIALGNVSFDLYSYELDRIIGNYRTDVNGEIFINDLRVGEYRLIERETNNQYNLAEETEITIKADMVNEVVVENELKKGNVKVLKVDKDNNEIKLADVVFEVQNEKGETLEIIKTNENGEAETSYYPTRDYENLRLFEISTNKYYKLNDKPIIVKLEPNKTTPITVQNEVKKGQIKVIKVDKDNNEIRIPDVEFNVLDENGNVVDNIKTDKSGEATTKYLPLGHIYKIQEEKTLNTYILNEDVKTIKLEKEDITNITFENEVKKGKIRVIKVDKDNNEIRIPDVEFNVLDENGNVVDNIKTDKNGEAVTKLLPITHTYQIQEVNTLDTYVLNDEIKTVNIEYNKISDVIFENELKKGKIRVIKVDKDNNEIKLEGVTFNVLDEKNNIVDTITTDSNGEATTKLLPITHTYRLQEVKTLDIYVLNEEMTSVKVDYKKITNVVVENELKKGQIRVIKIDKDNHEVKLQGVEFNVLDEDNNVVDKLVTDKNGEAVSKMLPIIHEYKLQEEKTLNTYVLNEEMQTIKLEEDQISNITFENEKIKGILTIEKVSKDDKDKKLENVEFGIYDLDGNLIETIKTDKEGRASTSLIPLGLYYAQELDTGSPYYLLNPDTFEFEITKENLKPTMTIEDEPTDITVDVDKTGDIETKPDDIVNYTFTNIANTSNTYLDKFEWYDYIPTDSVRLLRMESGTYNQELDYKVYYKTNKSDEYILFKEDLSTQENYDLDFTELELEEDEFITEVFFDFGKVDIGFRDVVMPTMQCKTLSTLQDGDTFTNETKTVGFYYDIKTETDSKWTTVVDVPEEPKEPTLPRTGK